MITIDTALLREPSEEMVTEIAWLIYDDRDSIKLGVHKHCAAIATYLEQHAGAGNLQEKFAGSPQLSIPPVKPTIEQRAWAIVHEQAPAWRNWYFRKYPNSKQDDSALAAEMAHYCVVATLNLEQQHAGTAPEAVCKEYPCPNSEGSGLDYCCSSDSACNDTPSDSSIGMEKS